MSENVIVYWVCFIFIISTIFPFEYKVMPNITDYYNWATNQATQGWTSMLILELSPLEFMLTFSPLVVLLIDNLSCAELYGYFFIHLWGLYEYNRRHIRWYHLLIIGIALMSVINYFFTYTIIDYSNMETAFTSYNTITPRIEKIGPKGLGYYLWLFSYIILFCGMIVKNWKNSRNKYNIVNYKQ